MITRTYRLPRAKQALPLGGEIIVPALVNHEWGKQIGRARVYVKDGEGYVEIRSTSTDTVYHLDGWPMVSAGGVLIGPFLFLEEVSIVTQGADPEAWFENMAEEVSP